MHFAAMFYRVQGANPLPEIRREALVQAGSTFRDCQNSVRRNTALPSQRTTTKEEKH